MLLPCMNVKKKKIQATAAKEKYEEREKKRRSETKIYLI